MKLPHVCIEGPKSIRDTIIKALEDSGFERLHKTTLLHSFDAIYISLNRRMFSECDANSLA